MYKNKKLRAALDSINKVRKHFQLKELKKIPKGFKTSPHECPIFIALADCGVTRVCGAHCITNNPLTAIQLARAMKTRVSTIASRPAATVVIFDNAIEEFVENFEYGSYPWLVLKDTQ